MMSLRWLPVLSALLAVFVVRAPCAKAQSVHARAQPLIYGADDRQELFESPSALFRQIGQRSIAALIDQRTIGLDDEGLITLQAPQLRDLSGDTLPICSSERFIDQPAAAHCGGVLVGPRHVLTAGHCVIGGECEGTALVFGYAYDQSGELPRLTPSDVYACTRVLDYRINITAGPAAMDYALLELDRDVDSGRAPVDLAFREVSLGESLTVIGFPLGVPMKVEGGATARTVRAEHWDYFTADADAFGGSSGSPVFNQRGELVGIMTRGGADFVPHLQDGCDQSRTVGELAPDQSYERIVYLRSAVFAACEVGVLSGGACDIEPLCGDGWCVAREDEASCESDCAPYGCLGAACAIPPPSPSPVARSATTCALRPPGKGSTLDWAASTALAIFYMARRRRARAPRNRQTPPTGVVRCGRDPTASARVPARS